MEGAERPLLNSTSIHRSWPFVCLHTQPPPTISPTAANNSPSCFAKFFCVVLPAINKSIRFLLTPLASALRRPLDGKAILLLEQPFHTSVRCGRAQKPRSLNPLARAATLLGSRKCKDLSDFALSKGSKRVNPVLFEGMAKGSFRDSMRKLQPNNNWKAPWLLSVKSS